MNGRKSSIKGESGRDRKNLGRIFLPEKTHTAIITPATAESKADLQEEDREGIDREKLQTNYQSGVPHPQIPRVYSMDAAKQNAVEHSEIMRAYYPTAQEEKDAQEFKTNSTRLERLKEVVVSAKGDEASQQEMKQLTQWISCYQQKLRQQINNLVAIRLRLEGELIALRDYLNDAQGDEAEKIRAQIEDLEPDHTAIESKIKKLQEILHYQAHDVSAGPSTHPISSSDFSAARQQNTQSFVSNSRKDTHAAKAPAPAKTTSPTTLSLNEQINNLVAQRMRFCDRLSALYDQLDALDQLDNLESAPKKIINNLIKSLEAKDRAIEEKIKELKAMPAYRAQEAAKEAERNKKAAADEKKEQTYWASQEGRAKMAAATKLADECTDITPSSPVTAARQGSAPLSNIQQNLDVNDHKHVLPVIVNASPVAAVVSPGSATPAIVSADNQAGQAKAAPASPAIAAPSVANSTPIAPVPESRARPLVASESKHHPATVNVVRPIGWGKAIVAGIKTAFLGVVGLPAVIWQGAYSQWKDLTGSKAAGGILGTIWSVTGIGTLSGFLRGISNLYHYFSTDDSNQYPAAVEPTVRPASSLHNAALDPLYRAGAVASAQANTAAPAIANENKAAQNLAVGPSIPAVAADVSPSVAARRSPTGR